MIARTIAIRLGVAMSKPCEDRDIALKLRKWCERWRRNPLPRRIDCWSPRVHVDAVWKEEIRDARWGREHSRAIRTRDTSSVRRRCGRARET
jgi:hypothetical protein